MEFSYFMPVRLLFGANVIDQLGATAKSYGTHALIVTGRSSTKRSGLLDRSIALLEAAGVRATVFNKVEPNPLTTTVMEGAALARTISPVESRVPAACPFWRYPPPAAQGARPTPLRC